jgi:hypothetical protein
LLFTPLIGLLLLRLILGTLRARFSSIEALLSQTVLENEQACRWWSVRSLR